MHKTKSGFPFQLYVRGIVIGPYLIHVALDPTVFSNTITNMFINLKAQIMSLLWIVYNKLKLTQHIGEI